MSTQQKKQVTKGKKPVPNDKKAQKRVTRAEKRKAARQRKKQVQAAPVKAPPTRKRNVQTVFKPGDSRVGTFTQSNMFMSGTTNVINQVIQYSSDSLQGISFAYICGALSRGWLANAFQNGEPFAAFQYMSTIWNAFLSGGAPEATQLPYWMWALGRAISPKFAPINMGQIYYKGTSALASPATPLFPCSPIAYGYEANLYVPAATGDTDLFPLAAAPTSTPPGEQSFLDLVGFVEGAINTKNNKMYDARVITVLDNDVSAFATVLAVTGYGSNIGGGMAFLATSEVPVLFPALAPVMTQVQNSLTGSPARMPNCAAISGGDELYVSTLLSTLLPTYQWGSKMNPKFKFIDFKQMQDIIAQWASKLVTLFFQSPAMKVTVSEGNVQNPLPQVCPITLQELGLILRNEIMFMFGFTQNGVQSILPILPLSSTDNQFQPYLTGSTGCAVQSYKMKLPQLFVENMRSLLPHKIMHGLEAEMLVPVIGQYANDVLSTTDYTFQTLSPDDTVTFTPTFVSAPTLLRRKRTTSISGKGEWVATTVETPIDFIDTSNGSSYVFINDPMRLQALVDLWNEWISQYANFTSPLTTLSADPGVNVLQSLNQTRYWAPTSISSLERYMDVKDARMEVRKELVNTPYSSKQVAAVSFRERPYAATGDVTNLWILPVALLQNGSASPNSQTFVKTEALYRETFSVTYSTTGQQGPTFATINSNFAALMTHAENAVSSLDTTLTDLSNKGQAGILSSLAASFIGHTFGATAGAIAGAVADVLPI